MVPLSIQDYLAVSDQTLMITVVFPASWYDVDHYNVYNFKLKRQTKQQTHAPNCSVM